MRLRLPPNLAGYLVLALLGTAAAGPAHGQFGLGGPPAVGVVKVEKKAITESSEYVGRIQAIDRVELTARVTAFIEERLFVEGTEVKQGDLLYRLERAPFEAAVQQQGAAVAEANAMLTNANITLGRAQALLNTPAGQRAAVDDARARQLSQAAQLMSAQAQLRQAQINLDYTEIRAPVTGKIGQTNLTVGNVVSPSSGPLATIVSQDPMYVVFPISVRAEIELQKRYTDRGGLRAVVLKLRLPDGTMYGQDGKIDFVAPTVAAQTDTILMRGRVANPARNEPQPGQPTDRPLTDGEFVTVLVEGIEPVQALGIPRAAVLEDQQGSYVFLVGPGNKVEQRRIQLGQSTAETAVVMAGLTEGETVIVDGIQRVRPGITVAPGPASQQPSAGNAGAGQGEGSQPGNASPATGQPSGGAGQAAGTSPSSGTPSSGTPAGGGSGSNSPSGTSR